MFQCFYIKSLTVFRNIFLERYMRMCVSLGKKMKPESKILLLFLMTLELFRFLPSENPLRGVSLFSIQTKLLFKPNTHSRCWFKSTCTEDEARLDIGASRLWPSQISRTQFDVKTFILLARYCPIEVKKAYKNHETLKN